MEVNGIPCLAFTVMEINPVTWQGSQYWTNLQNLILNYIWGQNVLFFFKSNANIYIFSLVMASKLYVFIIRQIKTIEDYIYIAPLP